MNISLPMPLFVKDVAKFFDVPESTIYQWVKKRGMPVHQVGEQYTFNRNRLFEWAIMTGTKVSPDILPKPKVEPLPHIADLLEEGGIFYGLEGDSKSVILREIVKLMPLPEDVDREFLLQVLLAREALSTTGIGDGIAIPHVRSPIVLHLSKPMITLCFLKHPINFGSLDGLPVTTLFTLVCPTVQAHLHLLSRLGFILRDPDFKTALVRQSPRDELISILRRIESNFPSLANHE